MGPPPTLEIVRLRDTEGLQGLAPLQHAPHRLSIRLSG